MINDFIKDFVLMNTNQYFVLMLYNKEFLTAKIYKIS